MNQINPYNKSVCNEKSSAWWSEWFNHVYMDVYSHRDEDSADAEIKSTMSVVTLNPDDKILDLCCGNGRHCRALIRAGLNHVYGVDYSFPLLEYAMSQTSQARYSRADMRLLPLPDNAMDVVLSFFTSFGYFPTNIENLSVLHEISRVIRSSGCFMLDYLNPTYVRSNLVAQSVKEHGDYNIREYRSISSDGERVEKKIVIENWGGKDHIYHESVRLYEYEEMKDMLFSADLSVDGVSGSFDNQPFNHESPRMILFGKRK
jgi:ubiquinone/menaquinone biosynthesis C-methylase UbiE